MLLSGHDLFRELNNKVLFDHISFSIQEKDKIALIGVNGTGKSTLLKTIARLDGNFSTKKQIKISYLEQSPEFKQNTPLEVLEALNAASQYPIEEYEMKSMLSKLGIVDFSISISSMSGGQKKRLALAAALMSKCDLLLLDEPTNHLDEETIDWLENQLIKTNTAILMVTHDRYFLDRVCTKLFELDHGQLYSVDGNYETYLEEKRKRLEVEKKQQSALENLYRKELDWVRAGVQARSTKSKSRLDRFEELRKQRTKANDARLQLESVSSRLGKKIIEWTNLGFHYPGQENLFSDFTYTIKQNDRIGIIGENGCGKSTFLQLLAGSLKPTQGTIERGETVKIGYFKQGDQDVDLNQRLIDYIRDEAEVIDIGKRKITASQMLERFMFDKNQQYLPISRLSGGERRRLYLAKVLMSAPNVLILDEPTNDLDLITLEILEDYLDSFVGIILAVSHDRYFLDRIVDHSFVFSDRHIDDYPGGYSDSKLRVQTKAKPKKEKKEYSRTRPKKLTYMEQKELKELPLWLEELEQEIAQLNEKMMQVSDYEKMAALSSLRDQKEKELEEKTERWMELEEKKENLNE